MGVLDREVGEGNWHGEVQTLYFWIKTVVYLSKQKNIRPILYKGGQRTITIGRGMHLRLLIYIAQNLISSS